MTERTPPSLPKAGITPAPDTLTTAESDAGAHDPAGGGCTSAPKPARLEPTRYGDWELYGKCVDF